MIKKAIPTQVEKENKKTILVDITNEQKDYSKKLAREIRKARKKQYKDKGKNAQKNAKKISYYGFLGEVVFADTFNLERPKLQEDIDKGIDFEFNNKTYQIKTTDKLDNGMVLFLNEKFKAERYVLINLNLKVKKAIIHKSLTKKQIKENCETKDFGYGDRLLISKDIFMDDGLLF